MDLGHGHQHRPISRRALLQGATAAGATVVATGLIGPGAVRAADDPRPRPIPGGIAVQGNGFHVNNPGPMVGTDPTAIDDMSAIVDFDGVLVVSHIQSGGTGHDKTTGLDIPLTFDTDMRFMQGTYVAMDGKRREGSFGFI